LEILLENSSLYISSLISPHKRYFYDTIDLDDKLIGLIGARGVGKTTFILSPHQQIIWIFKSMRISKMCIKKYAGLTS